MPFDLSASLGVLSLIVSLAMVIGGIVAFRSGLFKQSSEIQSQTIAALQARVSTLESQAQTDAKEIKRLRTIINTVRYTLKRRGMLIEIDGEYVTLVEGGQSKSSTHIQQPEDPTGKVRPLKQKSGTEEEDDAS